MSTSAKLTGQRIYLVASSVALYFSLWLRALADRFTPARQKGAPKVAIVLLSWKRLWNVPFVVRGLLKQRFVSRIYIWQNNPSFLPMPFCTSIYSRQNFRCRVRHTFALNLDCDWLMFIDDDLELLADFVSEFLNRPDIDRIGVAGCFSRALDRKNPTSCYSMGQPIESDSYRLTSNPIIGRLHLVRRNVLPHAFSPEFLADLSREEIDEDDLTLNLTVKRAGYINNLLVPLPPHRNLSMYVAARFGRSAHFQTRDRLGAKILQEIEQHETLSSADRSNTPN